MASTTSVDVPSLVHRRVQCRFVRHASSLTSFLSSNVGSRLFWFNSTVAVDFDPGVVELFSGVIVTFTGLWSADNSFSEQVLGTVLNLGLLFYISLPQVMSGFDLGQVVSLHCVAAETFSAD